MDFMKMSASLQILLLVTGLVWSVRGNSVCSELYKSEVGGVYNLEQLCDTVLETTLARPLDAKLTFSLTEKSVRCGEEEYTAGCIRVPGLNPTSVGSHVSITPKTENLPGAGVVVSLTGGFPCEAMPHKNRTATIHIQCPSDVRIHTTDSVPYQHMTGEEGYVPHICEYFVTIVSQAGCPLHATDSIIVSAVTGCKDSHPKAFTQNCSALGGSALSLYGTGFMNLESLVTEISIGQSASCDRINIVNDWTMQCTIRIESPLLVTQSGSYRLSIEVPGKESLNIDVRNKVVVSFIAVPDFGSLFNSLDKYGIGGMKQQANEIYEKVFLTRTLPAHILSELGLSHVRGLVLHGAPGTGKSLLARTIAYVMNADNVHLVSAPELLNKYVGESEYNLRTLFVKAERDWEELDTNSPFHVIILDELDAICKPRGRDLNNIGSLVYDSLVNQLLTKLDGLRQVDNLLVIGLTNRFELLETALLRPGRFEANIEMKLPNQKEREEIFAVHLAKAVKAGRLAAEVNINRLAQITVGFTPAQIMGVVRRAQSSALWSAQTAGSADQTTLRWKDFETALADAGMHRGDNLTVSQCGSYVNVYDVVNSNLPKTALIGLERYRQIMPCLQLLLEQRNFYVKVYRPEDVLRDPLTLSSVHQVATSVRNKKVAVVIADLCHMVGLCYGNKDVSTDEKVHMFLLSMKAFLDIRDRETSVIAVCQSYCQTEYLKPHFTYLFGMVAVDSLTAPSLTTQNRTLINSTTTKH